MNVLFVCTGNTCRSPMAEALARRELERRGLADWQVGSAGVMARSGSPATAEASAEMSRRGLSLRDHRSRMVTGRAVEQADCILAMTAAHRDLLLDRYPRAGGKANTLGDFAGTGEDIPDPLGGGRAVYRACADRLEALIGAAFDRLAGP